MSQLSCLVYVSSAVREVSQADIDHLLKRAWARNLGHRVSGALLYAAGDFMQYIEGPEAGLAEVYRHIRADPLHTGIIELLREPIAEREFGEWLMAYRALGGGRDAEPPQQRPGLVERILGPDGGAPASSARILLRSFWNRRPGRA
jgi:hypothetical protein